MKIKEYENKEESYYGIDLCREPDSQGFEADIEVKATKWFEYTTVNGFTSTNNIRIWLKAKVKWRAQAWGDSEDAAMFGALLRDAWIKAIQMDYQHGLIKK